MYIDDEKMTPAFHNLKIMCNFIKRRWKLKVFKKKDWGVHCCRANNFPIFITEATGPIGLLFPCFLNTEVFVFANLHHLKGQ